MRNLKLHRHDASVLVRGDALLDGKLGEMLDAKEKILADAKKRTFVGAQLEVRRDPETERWTVSLVSRTSREDVIVAWKQTEEDAVAWAQNYGMRK